MLLIIMVFISFNSTLVQLKDCFNIHIQGSQKRFNSTLVQLKETGRYMRFHDSMFQFYLSSIKSR